MLLSAKIVQNVPIPLYFTCLFIMFLHIQKVVKQRKKRAWPTKKGPWAISGERTKPLGPPTQISVEGSARFCVGVPDNKRMVQNLWLERTNPRVRTNQTQG